MRGLYSPPQLPGARQLAAAYAPLAVELHLPDAEHQQKHGDDPGSRLGPQGTRPLNLSSRMRSRACHAQRQARISRSVRTSGRPVGLQTS